ncbi:MAG: acetyl-coenzyme A synthetase N-terminal domain-containing protein, partial [Bacteroidia bacterium]
MIRIRTFEQYQTEYQKSVSDPEAFWAEQAASFRWHTQWTRVLEWDFKQPNINWFVG